MTITAAVREERPVEDERHGMRNALLHTAVWATNIPFFAMFVGCVVVQARWLPVLAGEITRAAAQPSERSAKDTSTAV